MAALMWRRGVTTMVQSLNSPAPSQFLIQVGCSGARYSAGDEIELRLHAIFYLGLHFFLELAEGVHCVGLPSRSSSRREGPGRSGHTVL